MLSLSLKERDRLVVLRQLDHGELTVAEAARRLGRTTRHVRRLLRRFEREGDGVVMHGLRGRPSNRRLNPTLREQALAKAREPLYHDFGPTLLSEHLERDPAIGPVHPATLRLWLIEAGLWQPKARKTRHRRRRERRAARGDMVLMDTSIHDWLEHRSQEEIVLIAMIDDATSDLFCRFFPRDTGAANRRLIIDYLEHHGRPGAIYADRAGHFKVHFRSKERRERDQAEALTLIRRGLDALEIELILALSPQAKGRVERLFGTLQDRLIKEMRVADVTSMAAANRFLEEVFIPFWQDRFTHEPKEAADAHRTLPKAIDLLQIFAETEERVIRADFTFRYKNVHYQIEEKEADGAMPKTRITLEHRLDGTTRYRWRERYLSVAALPDAPTRKSAKKPTPKKDRPLSGAAGKPIPTHHPWRRFPVLVGKNDPLREPIAASAASPLRPDTPASTNGTTPSP